MGDGARMPMAGQGHILTRGRVGHFSIGAGRGECEDVRVMCAGVLADPRWWDRSNQASGVESGCFCPVNGRESGGGKWLEKRICLLGKRVRNAGQFRRGALDLSHARGEKTGGGSGGQNKERKRS